MGKKKNKAERAAAREQQRLNAERKRIEHEQRRLEELERQKRALELKQVNTLAELQRHYNNHVSVKNLSNIDLSKNKKTVTCLLQNDETYPVTIETDGKVEELVAAFIKAIDKSLRNYRNEQITQKAEILFSSYYDYHILTDKVNEQLDNIQVKIEKDTTTLTVEEYGLTKTLDTKELTNFKKAVKVKNDLHKFCESVSCKKTKEEMLEIIVGNVIASIKKQSYNIPTVREMKDAALEEYHTYDRLIEDKFKTKRYMCSEFSYTLFLSDFSICAKNKEMEVRKNSEGIQIVLRNQFAVNMELVKSDTYQTAKTLLQQFLTSTHDYKITEFYCMGCFDGYTGLKVSTQNFSDYYIKLIDTLKETEIIEDWFTRITDKIQQEVDKKNREIEEKRKRDYVRTREFRESFIARDIVDFVERNASYITEKAVIQYIRGNKVQLNTEIEPIPNFVPYKNYDASEVADVIYHLVSKDVLMECEYDGTFMIFYTLRPFWDVCKQVLTDVEEKRIVCDPFSQTKFNDFQAERVFLKYEQKTDLKMKDYVMLLNLTSAKGFFCRYYDRYVTLIQTAPKEFKKFVKMRIDTEDNTFEKKFLKEIVKTKK